MPSSLVAPAPAPCAAPGAADDSAGIALWARIVRSPSASPMLRAVLTNSSLVEIRDAVAVLCCPSRFAPGARARMAELVKLFEMELGRRFEVHIVEPGEDASSPAASAESAARPAVNVGSADATAAVRMREVRRASAPATAAGPPAPAPDEDPLVRLAIELFEARIVSIQPHATKAGEN